jgi:GAF domain-containing protein
LADAECPDSGLFAAVAAHVQDLVLADTDAEGLLAAIAGHAATALGTPECGLWCGISLARPKKPLVVVGSDPRARLLMLLEGRNGDGPGVDADRSGAGVLSPDLSLEERWPDYAGAARRQGIASVLCLPLQLDDDATGLVSIYSRRRDGFADGCFERAEGFVAQASKGLTLALRMTKLRETRDGMSAAMKSRTVIDLATGAIMAQNKCDQDSAFRVLLNASNSRNLKLRDVAGAVITSVAGEGRVITYFDE